MFAGIVFVVTIQCFGSNVILKQGIYCKNTSFVKCESTNCILWMIHRCYVSPWRWAGCHRVSPSLKMCNRRAYIWWKKPFCRQRGEEPSLRRTCFSFCSPVCRARLEGIPGQDHIELFEWRGVYTKNTNNLFSDAYLDVMLHEWIERFPSETLGQFLRSDWPIAELKFVKYSLQSKSHTSLSIITLCRHFVHCFA